MPRTWVRHNCRILVTPPTLTCRLHREPKHLMAFLMAELGTSGSIDGSNQLIIKGKFMQKQVESVLKKYISKSSAHFGNLSVHLVQDTG